MKKKQLKNIKLCETSCKFENFMKTLYKTKQLLSSILKLKQKKIVELYVKSNTRNYFTLDFTYKSTLC